MIDIQRDHNLIETTNWCWVEDGKKTPREGTINVPKKLIDWKRNFLYLEALLYNFNWKFWSLLSVIRMEDWTNRAYKSTLSSKCVRQKSMSNISWGRHFFFGDKKDGKNVNLSCQKMWFQILGSRQTVVLPHGHYERMF